MIRSVIRGVGACLPTRIVSNDELATRVDTSDAWIRERTGIALEPTVQESPWYFVR